MQPLAQKKLKKHLLELHSLAPVVQEAPVVCQEWRTQQVPVLLDPP